MGVDRLEPGQVDGVRAETNMAIGTHQDGAGATQPCQLRIIAAADDFHQTLPPAAEAVKLSAFPIAEDQQVVRGARQHGAAWVAFARGRCGNVSSCRGYSPVSGLPA